MKKGFIFFVLLGLMFLSTQCGVVSSELLSRKERDRKDKLYYLSSVWDKQMSVTTKSGERWEIPAYFNKYKYYQPSLDACVMRLKLKDKNKNVFKVLSHILQDQVLRDSKFIIYDDEDRVMKFEMGNSNRDKKIARRFNVNTWEGVQSMYRSYEVKVVQNMGGGYIEIIINNPIFKLSSESAHRYNQVSSYTNYSGGKANTGYISTPMIATWRSDNTYEGRQSPFRGYKMRRYYGYYMEEGMWDALYWIMAQIQDYLKKED